MKDSDNLVGKPPAPDGTAYIKRLIHIADKTYFGTPAVCLAAVILLVVEHEWLYAAGFAASALLYFAVSLPRHRYEQQMFEDIIQCQEQGKRSLSPEATTYMKRLIRSGYKTNFYPVVIWLSSAILFAIWHEWLYVAGAIVSALVFFPSALSSYRSSREGSETTIRRLEQWQQQQDSPSEEQKEFTCSLDYHIS